MKDTHSHAQLIENKAKQVFINIRPHEDTLYVLGSIYNFIQV